MRWTFGSRRPTSAVAAPKGAGAGCLIPFGLIFLGMGLLFTFFLVRQILAEAETYRWPATPCEIVACEVFVDGQRDSPFRLDVTYRYEVAGQTHESNRLGLQEKWSDSYEKLALKRRAFLSDPDAVCYVNPASATEAVLQREHPAAALFVLIPLIFVVVGATIVWAGVASFRKQKQRALSAQPSATPTAAGPPSRRSSAIFGVVFTVIGLGASLPFLLGPVRKMAESRHWVETPCTIVWSRVISHDSDDGTTYSVDIFYEYQFAGQTHRSNRYRFLTGSSSGYAGKKAVVDRHPAGSTQVCHVNPDLPEQAVLVSGFTPGALFAGIPIAFLLIGLAALFSSVKPAPASPLAAGLLSASGSGGSTSGEPLVLCPAGSRKLKAGGCLLGAVFWNGIVSLFVADTIEGWQNGGGDWFQTLFMIPFVLVGLGLVFGFFYQLLALANPRPTVVLPAGAPRAGETVEVLWELTGRTSRVTRLSISLWGIETATYRQGTSTATSREVFYDATLAEAVDEMDIRQGKATLTLPADLMHSLKLPNNQIHYQIRIHGEIPLWPDIADHFDVTLLPLRSNPV
ncbi:MAG: DUF3592 domain-containing protein [Verrucomicrobiales bacterium]|nr:DUF3592 domain-containing protein [Verrucomicrobiales bacterium]